MREVRASVLRMSDSSGKSPHTKKKKKRAKFSKMMKHLPQECAVFLKVIEMFLDASLSKAQVTK